MKSIADRLFVALQYLLPRRWLSREMYYLTRCEVRVIKNSLISIVRRLYRIDLSEAANPDPHSYPSFNAFFTRALRPGARPQPGTEDSIISPVDGTLSCFGYLDDQRLIQAKGQTYSVREFLGSASAAATYSGGAYATIYLAPGNYHRVHMPAAGRLNRTLRIPGDCFGVDERSMRYISNLLVRNERVVTFFQSPAGPLAVALVGALMVGSISLAVTEARKDLVPGMTLERGAELGRFNMGSTVIALFTKDRVQWSADLVEGQSLRMGQEIGKITGNG